MIRQKRAQYWGGGGAGPPGAADCSPGEGGAGGGGVGSNAGADTGATPAPETIRVAHAAWAGMAGASVGTTISAPSKAAATFETSFTVVLSRRWRQVLPPGAAAIR